MCTAAGWLRGEQPLNDLLEVFVEGEMTLLRVQRQAASRHPSARCFAWCAGTATDKVGHTKSETCSYSVNYGFSGFLQPINWTAHQVMGTNASNFKAGSTVPVKFRLTDANGNPVQAGSAQWLPHQKLTSTSQAVDEATYSDPATAGTLYKWDPTAQQYVYNWSTKGMSSGFYYKIGVKLDDGQTYYTYISLR